MYRYYNDYLMHYGVKGMRWGIRKDPERARRKSEKKARKSFNRHWTKTYNKAAKQFNSKIGDINKRYKGNNLGDQFETKTGQKYVKELNKMWQTEYKKALKEDYGEYGKMFIDDAPYMNQYVDFIK